MDALEVEPPYYIQISSPEKRQRWEEEHRRWAHAYADAQVRREAEERRRQGEEEAVPYDADFLTLPPKPEAAEAEGEEQWLSRLMRL